MRKQDLIKAMAEEREATKVLLASNFSIDDYYESVRDADRQRLANFVERRYLERYIRPISGPQRHGFAIMAICCLMIESLVSFRNGWRKTIVDGHEAFEQFFNSDAVFGELAPLSAEFYGHVRNAIFHQAETTGGWRIRRDEHRPLFESANRTIQADKFRDAVERSLLKYCGELRVNDWNSPIWENLITKVDSICKKAEPPK